MTETVLEVRGVTKKVRGRKLVDDVSFEVKKGEICGFLGPNGAGKTTLIRLLTGLIAPTSGDLRIGGVNVQQDRKTALRKIGAMVESPVFFPYLTGRKNLLNLARLHPELAGKQAREERVNEVLALVGLAGRGDDKVGTYSLGMKQRLGIAQALLGRPDAVILDEPANGLDPLGMRELRELILSLREQYGLTFFVSSHLLDELQQICSRLVVIREGRLLWQGETRELVGRAGADGRLEDAFVELVRG